jgi:hypothetical protein
MRNHFVRSSLWLTVDGDRAATRRFPANGRSPRASPDWAVGARRAYLAAFAGSSYPVLRTSSCHRSVVLRTRRLVLSAEYFLARRIGASTAAAPGPKGSRGRTPQRALLSHPKAAPESVCVRNPRPARLGGLGL